MDRRPRRPHMIEVNGRCFPSSKSTERARAVATSSAPPKPQRGHTETAYWAIQSREFSARHHLSPQEAVVLTMAISGRYGKEIAAILNCSPHTISTYWKRIYKRTGYSGQAAVIAAVLRDE